MHPEAPKDWPLRDYWEATQTLARTLKGVYTTLGLLAPDEVATALNRVLETSLDDISAPGFEEMTNQVKSLEEKLQGLQESVVEYAESLRECANQLEEQVPRKMRAR